MVKEIPISEKLTKKLLNDVLKASNDKWYKTVYNYMIDSKFRVTCNLQNFLESQILYPKQSVQDLANKYLKQSNDDKIISILKYVHKNISYISDRKQYNKDEYWASAEETLRNGFGDCDDINSLIHILALLSGVPDYLLYSAIGMTSSGGHYWLIYLSTRHKKEGCFVPIDGTYYPDYTKVIDRDKFELSKEKYQNIWYLFNSKGIYKYK